jgi:hypothetical protein
MTTSTNRAIALLDNFGGAVPACPPDLNYPQIWRLDAGEWVEYPNKDGDVYTAIFNFSNRHQFSIGKPVGDAFVVRTVGYGAPLGEDGKVGDVPPSQHPLRFRVALDICAEPSGSIGSRLSCHGGDKDGEVLDDTGMATGALAEAVDLAAFRVWGRAFTSSLIADYADNADNKEDEEVQHLAHRVARFLDALGAEDE